MADIQHHNFDCYDVFHKWDTQNGKRVVGLVLRFQNPEADEYLHLHIDAAMLEQIANIVQSYRE